MSFQGGEFLLHFIYSRINEIENFCKETKLLELVDFFEYVLLVTHDAG